MAYGAILGQNPNLSAYAKKEGLPVSDIRELTIRDGESISAGDVVNVGGSPDAIYKDVTPQDNVENMIYNNSVTASDIVKLNDTYSVVCFVISNGAHVMLVDNQTGKVVGSTPSVSPNFASSVSLARLDDSHFVVGYSSSTGTGARIGTVTGASISLGTAKSFAGSEYHLWGFSIISESIMIVFMDGTPGGNLQARVYPYSGNTIGDPLSGPVLSGQQNYASITDLPDDSSGNKRVCICFSDTGDGNKGKAVIATIDSSNAVTFGDVVTFANGGATSYTSCASIGDQIAISYVYSGNWLQLLTANGNVLTLGGERTTYGTGTGSYGSVSVLGSKFVIAFNSSSKGEAQVLNIVGNQLIAADEFNFNSANTYYISSTPVSDNQIIVAYADAGNSNYGTTTILTVDGNQIAGSFIDSSQDAIALADGTGGQEIPVGFGGYCECPGVTEGQTIDSSGVSAVAVQDGWLLIKDAWSKGYVTGEYTGTGENAFSIDVGFKPSVVLIQQIGPISGAGSQTANYVAFVDGSPYGAPFSNASGTIDIDFTDTGVLFNSNTLNNPNYKYYYAAWR